MTKARFFDTIPPKLRERYRTTAHHEAGHAIIGFKLGLRSPREVSIIPEENRLGRVQRKPWPPSFQPETEIRPRDRLLIENQIVVFLAGHEAERRFTKRSNPQGAASDYSNAAEFAIRIGGDGEGASAFVRWCSFCARREVAFNWSSIKKFAQILLNAGVLKGNKLRDALNEACLAPGMTLAQFKAFQTSMREVAKKLKGVNSPVNAPTQASQLSED